MVWLKKLTMALFKAAKSLKMAVVIIIAIGVISAVGTVYESMYDAEYAQKMVYHSVYMNGALILLCITLIAVMIDRWPWKPKHSGFLLAHIGIILTLVGAYVTQKAGVDGSMAFGIGESNRYVSVPDHELGIWASSSGERVVNLATRKTDFLRNSPQDQPLELKIGDKVFKALDYYHYAHKEEQIEPSDKELDGPALRLQLFNDRVNMTEWVLASSTGRDNALELGPAKVVLSKESFKYSTGNVVALRPAAEGLGYEVYTESKGGLSKQGLVRQGDQIDLGWMGLQLRALRIIPRARKTLKFNEQKYPTKRTVAALKFQFGDDEHWMSLNSVLRLFDKNQMYMISWGNRRIDLGFDMRLKNFEVGRYEGTMKAASYQSLVEVPGEGETLISMNEPLKYRGFTFYQASFEQDETGKPTASILSVNYDPGRGLKYLGSLLIVLGSIMLFYFKKIKGRKKVIA